MKYTFNDPAILHPSGVVNCEGCQGCVSKNNFRASPRGIGGLGFCRRLTEQQRDGFEYGNAFFIPLGPCSDEKPLPYHHPEAYEIWEEAPYCYRFSSFNSKARQMTGKFSSNQLYLVGGLIVSPTFDNMVIISK